MKSLLRNTTINSISLYFTSIVISGLIVKGGFVSFLLAGIVLSIMNVTIKPIFSILSLPLNIVTLGFFSFFSSAIILYILTILLPSIQIVPFTFPGLSFIGFIAPKMYFNQLFAYVAVSFILSIIISFFEWIIKK